MHQVGDQPRLYYEAQSTNQHTTEVLLRNGHKTHSHKNRTQQRTLHFYFTVLQILSFHLPLNYLTIPQKTSLHSPFER